MGALAGPPKPSFIAKVHAGELGGVILVGRWTPKTMRATTAQLHAAGCTIRRPLLMLVDQEGGYARRLTWAAPERTARELGELGVARTQQQGRAAAAALRAAGVDVDDRVADHEYGRFGWATDPEGNRFELWEPT